MRGNDSLNGIKLRCYAGTTGIILAMDVVPSRRKNLLGFAIERERLPGGRWKWLQGLLRFPGQARAINTPVDSNLAPFQKFRWSDYCVYPDTKYKYKVTGVYGTPSQLKYVSGPEVEVKTEPLYKGAHQIIFNRAAAASQAYKRKFGSTNPDDTNDPRSKDARVWLSRGLQERLYSFLNRALDSNWALDIAIYEFELPEIADILEKARRQGAQIRVIYHAKEGDEQTEINTLTLIPLKTNDKLPRQTNAIFHHKFCILSRVTPDGRREPQSVLTGSTNFTPNGVYRQANVVHIIENKAIARNYLELFEELFQGADPRETKSYINTKHPVKPGSIPQAVFSPRSKFSDIQEVAAIVQKASRDLVFCTTFNLHPDICQALLGTSESDIIRYGLQNSRTKITGTHRYGQFTATAMFKSGLEGFLKETTAGQKGNILVHLKTILTDFSTNNPTVITGSNNFSANASSRNDENMLIIGGETSVADVYACEMMRLYDHYRFRYNQRAKGQRGPKKRLTLYDSDEWTARYFQKGTLPYLERIRFSGGNA